MAIYDVDAIKEQEEIDNNDSIIDGMLEACEAMMGIIEADSTLKNERKVHSTHGPEDYSKWSDDDLKNEFKDRREYSDMAKWTRGKKHMYVKGGTTIATSNRTKAEAIGKELAKRGIDPSDLKKKAIKETCLTILSVIDDI